MLLYLLLLCLPSEGKIWEDKLHGIRVDLPSDYIVHILPQQGRILIERSDYKGGISILILRNPKDKNPAYFLKVFGTLIPRKDFIYKQLSNNKAIGICKASYADFIPFFDANYSFAVLLSGMYQQQVKAVISVFRGKKFSLVFIIVPPPEEDISNLLKIVRSFELSKPKIPFKTAFVKSPFLKCNAFSLNLPKGWTIVNRATFTKVGELPFFCAHGKEGGVCLVYLQTSFLQSSLMVAGTAIIPGVGEQLISQAITSPEAAINFYLRLLRLPEAQQVEYTRSVDWLKNYFNLTFNPVGSQTLMIAPAITLLSSLRLSAPNLEGNGWIAEIKLSSPQMLSTGYVGSITVWWGNNKEAISVARGVASSITPTLEWLQKSLKVQHEELKKEIAHRRWIWNEFKRTNEYIKKLHEKSMKEERIFQEEMARALTNILSDYTYARDPETGEVFHLEDDAKEYWRTEEGEIVKFENEVLDPEKLKAEGWRKLEVRVEGFGKW
jgi:hypothetical protein